MQGPSPRRLSSRQTTSQCSRGALVGRIWRSCSCLPPTRPLQSSAPILPNSRAISRRCRPPSARCRRLHCRRLHCRRRRQARRRRRRPAAGSRMLTASGSSLTPARRPRRPRHRVRTPRKAAHRRPRRRPAAGSRMLMASGSSRTAARRRPRRRPRPSPARPRRPRHRVRTPRKAAHRRPRRRPAAGSRMLMASGSSRTAARRRPRRRPRPSPARRRRHRVRAPSALRMTSTRYAPTRPPPSISAAPTRRASVVGTTRTAKGRCVQAARGPSEHACAPIFALAFVSLHTTICRAL